MLSRLGARLASAPESLTACRAMPAAMPIISLLARLVCSMVPVPSALTRMTTSLWKQPVENAAAARREPAVRGGSAAAFDGRCIPALGVARRLNIPDIRPPRALIAGRLARLDATPHFHHGPLGRACASGQYSLSTPALSPSAADRRARPPDDAAIRPRNLPAGCGNPAQGGISWDTAGARGSPRGQSLAPAVRQARGG